MYIFYKCIFCVRHTSGTEIQKNAIFEVLVGAQSFVAQNLLLDLQMRKLKIFLKSYQIVELNLPRIGTQRHKMFCLGCKAELASALQHHFQSKNFKISSLLFVPEKLKNSQRTFFQQQIPFLCFFSSSFCTRSVFLLDIYDNIKLSQCCIDTIKMFLLKIWPRRICYFRGSFFSRLYWFSLGEKIYILEKYNVPLCAKKILKKIAVQNFFPEKKQNFPLKMFSESLTAV